MKFLKIVVNVEKIVVITNLCDIENFNSNKKLEKI